MSGTTSEITKARRLSLNRLIGAARCCSLALGSVDREHTHVQEVLGIVGTILVDEVSVDLALSNLLEFVLLDFWRRHHALFGIVDLLRAVRVLLLHERARAIALSGLLQSPGLARVHSAQGPAWLVVDSRVVESRIVRRRHNGLFLHWGAGVLLEYREVFLLLGVSKETSTGAAVDELAESRLV